MIWKLIISALKWIWGVSGAAEEVFFFSSCPEMEAFCEDDHQLSYFPAGIHWGPALFGALASFSSRPGDMDSAWVDHSGSRMLMPSACLFPFEFSMELSVTSGTTGVIFINTLSTTTVNATVCQCTMWHKWHLSEPERGCVGRLELLRVHISLIVLCL